MKASSVSPKTPTWAAIVLYYRSPETIEATIRSLLAQEPPAMELVVVDNHSRDGLDERLANLLGGKVSLVVTDQNGGYATGMNRGRRALRSNPNAILFATHEVLLDSGCAARLLDAVTSGEAVIAGPRLRLPDGVDWSLGGEILWTGGVRHRTRGASKSLAPCAWVDGSVLMANHDTFDALGGFDPAYFLYWEDVDLGLRARNLGAVVCVTDAIAVQNTSMAPQDISTRNRLWLWRRHHSRVRVVLSVFDVLGRIVVRDLPTARWSIAGPRLRGLRQGLLESPRDAP